MAPLTSPSPAAKGQGEAGASVRLTRLDIAGNTVFDSATLTRVAGLAPDTDVTLADLQAAADRITAFYRAAGYLVARAYVPAQQVAQGHITLGVLEGTLDGASVTNHSRLSDARLTRTLTHRLKNGEPLQSASANRDILLLQQLPGAGNVKAELTPGNSVGSTRIGASVDKAPLADGQLSLDNYGNSFSGEYRGNALMHLNNLAGIGDRLTLAATLAEAGRLAYGRLAWDAPVGYDGLRLGAAYSRTDYELGDAFAALDAHGTANTASLTASYPWVLTPATHVNVDASLDHRRLQDNLLGSTLDNKTINALVLGLGGDLRDNALGSYAVTAWRLANTSGKLDLDAPASRWTEAAAPIPVVSMTSCKPACRAPRR